MNLDKFSEEELVLTAMRSEIQSRDFYAKLAGSVKNFLLKDRLEFLSKEEEKHRIFFENTYKDKFPGKKIVLPRESPVPLPELKIPDESMAISDVFWSAMQAEKAAHEFYTELAERLKGDDQLRKSILYIATMEMGHYKLLEVERENAERFEDYDVEWPLFHVGP